jgi:hypothetical protein
MDALWCAVQADGIELAPQSFRPEKAAIGILFAGEYGFPGDLSLHLSVHQPSSGVLLFSASLANRSRDERVLNRLAFLKGTAVSLGLDPARVQCIEHLGHVARSVPLARCPGPPPTAVEQDLDARPPGERPRSSLLYWLAHDRRSARCLLVAWESSERWLGEVRMARDGASWWEAGFDGGDIPLLPGEVLPLEELRVAVGNDPLSLLEEYGEAARRRFPVHLPPPGIVSWCSWYPYRLGITEERVLAEARIASQRLKPLGLGIIQVDLGWQAGYVCSSIVENDQFPHGLKWLSERLSEMGFRLGIWTAPYTVSALDPVVAEHPSWIVRDKEGKPASTGTWFWPPHGAMHILDLTNPEALAWLRTRIASLAARGVEYLKADFINCAWHELAKRRHDPRVVLGGGLEGARAGARVIREAFPQGLILNSGGIGTPGTGHWPLLYACLDTGNTGFGAWEFHRDNYQSLACHLFMNGRWGVLQPSCLCVGLPGTIEEARLRATAAFLTGGQIDISDALTTLPEDRWQILSSTLPTLGASARAVDLLDPLSRVSRTGSGAPAAGAAEASIEGIDHPPGSVWHLPVAGSWDQWDLVAVFSFDSQGPAGSHEIQRYTIPFSLLSLDPRVDLWAYEFWSGQFLGGLPGGRRNPGGYTHPGDFQDLVCAADRGILEVAFVGPGVKLICVRKCKPHPWVVGTSFHQSCGAELAGVSWDPEGLRLSGRVRRPSGERGHIAFAAPGWRARAEVEGRVVPLIPGAHGALLLPVTLEESEASWSLTCARQTPG